MSIEWSWGELIRGVIAAVIGWFSNVGWSKAKKK